MDAEQWRIDALFGSTDKEAINDFFVRLNERIIKESKRGYRRKALGVYANAVETIVQSGIIPSGQFLEALQHQWQYTDVYETTVLALWCIGDVKRMGDQRSVRCYLRLLQRLPPVGGARKYLGIYPKFRSAQRLKFRSARLKHLYTENWLQLICARGKMNTILLSDTLVCLSENVLKNVTSPMLFSDFVISSFQSKHPLNALSLGSVVFLMVKCNLEYPKLYAEVYAMLKQNIFTMAHRTIFFRYLDMIMRSTHIPVSIIAAYVKRLSRLTLFAPADCCLTLLGLIRTWLIRHPGSQFLVNRPAKQSASVESDPFDFDATDPDQSEAMKSSLWEIKTLKHHFLDKVVKTAAFIDSRLPSVEVPYRLESDVNRIFRDERRVAAKEYTATTDTDSKLFHLDSIKMDLFSV